MERVYNFSAGPSVLPQEVLKTAQTELLSYKNSGQSVLEMSHRSPEFKAILKETKLLLRRVMKIPYNYEILFLQGGASSQFAMVPMNLMSRHKKADFVITGQWANKAFLEAKKFGKCKIIASSEDKNFSYIPKMKKDAFSRDSDYAHICLNNTIYGTKFTKIPDTGKIPLVADVSSCILSEPLDVTKFGVLYAGAQKNLAPAGLTVVVVRKDLIGTPIEHTPTMFDYSIHAKNDSLYNTPPCFQIYMCKLVLAWIEKLGGLKKMQEINFQKANYLYEFLENSTLFKGTAAKEYRSIMNVTFTTGDKEVDTAFINAAKENKIVNIGGHRKVGGMRASIYNAMPIEGIEHLVDFMQRFEKSRKL